MPQSDVVEEEEVAGPSGIGYHPPSDAGSSDSEVDRIEEELEEGEGRSEC